MEYGAQNEERLLTGREMIRAICYWCSVRSELGQRHVHQQLDGVRPPSDEMRASIHAHFIKPVSYTHLRAHETGAYL
eukprot:6417104-Pyramimonas_sp.AAC.1